MTLKEILSDPSLSPKEKEGLNIIFQMALSLRQFHYLRKLFEKEMENYDHHK